VAAEFFVGRKHAWLFEVRKGAINVHDLGPAHALEQMARKLHLEWRSYQKAAGDRLLDARRFSDLLYGQLAPLANDDSLVVIADGPLHVVPMATLARQAVAGGRGEPVRVAVTLASLINGRTGTEHGSQALLAVIADPVYAADDPRIRAARPAVNAPPSAGMPKREAGELARMRRLPATATEAAAIIALADDRGTLALTGTDASRPMLASAQLDRYRIVHFATHGFSDSRDPALAMLALSQFDENGQPLEGSLRSYDIAELRLNAELVVLSACNTAIGREVAGDAPLGLAHAFLRSGARSVLATLWQVPDTSSARFMEEFYRQLLVQRRHPALALELAQERIRGQLRWSDPYYWAGFQLTSNARFDGGKENVDGRGE
jgi:CHAT domain-containing protein